MRSIPVSEIDHIVEKKGPSGGSGEASAQQLTSIGERRFAARTHVQTLATDVFQEDTTHLGAMVSW